MKRAPKPPTLDRVQTGVRMDKRLVKVLKAVAQLRDLSLGELLEVMVDNVFAGRLPFDDAGLAQVRELLAIYGVAPAAPAAPAAVLLIDVLRPALPELTRRSQIRPDPAPSWRASWCDAWRLRAAGRQGIALWCAISAPDQVSPALPGPGATPLWRARRRHVGSGTEALARSMLIDMSRTLEQIEDEVLRLPEESRVRLMERLLSSFQEQAGSEEEGIARAWVEEAERRDDEMSSGREEGLPAQEVISKLRSSRR